MEAKTGPAVKLSAVIVRACDKCNGKRQLGKPCLSCGNTEPAKATDLGVIASTNPRRWEQIKWNLWGYRAAQRRIKKANKEIPNVGG